MTAGVGRRRARRWPLSSATVRAVLSGHGLLGLSFAAIIYLVCLSGTIAVFAHDIERWEAPGAPRIAAIAPAALDRALAAAQRQAPPGTTLFASLPSPDAPGAEITAFGPSFERDWAVNEAGKLIARETPIATFLIDLHIALHLPRTWGGFLVGLTGVALLSSLISGVLAHPRIFRDAFHLRLGGSRRLQEADLHNRLGVWALPFHFVLALTGALLGLSTIIIGVLGLLLYRGDTTKVYALLVDAPPAVDARRAPLPPVAGLLAEAQRRAPDAVPSQLVVERAGRADARITVTSARDRLLVPQDTTVFDAAGCLTAQKHPRDLSLGTKLVGGIGQLHFGWFGGVVVRLLYGALGLALCVVTSSGVTIWLARRRDKARAAPRWERLWAAVVWGQPLALALAALAATLSIVSNNGIVWIWVAMTALLLIASGAWQHASGPMIAARLRLMVGAVLAILVPASVVARGLGGDGAAISVDLVLLIAGLYLLYDGLASRPAAAAVPMAAV